MALPIWLQFFPLVICGGLFLKVFIIHGVWVNYFEYRSTVKLDHTTHCIDAKPLAKRIVLFACDGLTTDDLMMNENQAEFLTDIRKNSGLWGFALPREPTRCRSGLGPDSILTGISKDYSLLYTDWKTNETDIDSVIKQCRNAYYWGSSKVNPAYGKVSIQAHFDLNKEDQTKHHDQWILKRLRGNLNNRRNFDCGVFCDPGNIFIVHLLGMSAFPFLLKTDTEKYLSQLTSLSDTVKNATTALDSFFNFDNGTAYIFMSKRGIMTCGSPHENDLFVMSWGAGLAANTNQQDINQIDLAPLIAILLGINIPKESTGRIPLQYINGSNHQKAGALLANVKQIAETFFQIYRFGYGYGFIQFNKLTPAIVRIIIETLDEAYHAQRYDLVMNNGNHIINLCLEAIQYYNDFYKQVSLVCMTVLMVLWCGCTLIYMRWRINVFFSLCILGQILLLAYSCINRRFLALAILVVALWGNKTYKNLSARLSERWFYTLTCVSILVAETATNEFNFLDFAISIVAFIIINKMYGEVSSLLILTCSCTNMAGIAWLYSKGYAVAPSFFFTSSVMLNTSLSITWRSNRPMIKRLNAIIWALFCNYTQMIVHREGIFYCVLVVLLYTWLELEFRNMQPTDEPNAIWTLLSSLYYDTCPRERHCINNEDMRRGVFFITFLIASLCSIEGSTSVIIPASLANSPSNAFSVTNTYQTSLGIITVIGKPCILMSLCAFVYIMVLRVTRSNILKTFTILILFSNIFVYFLFIIVRKRLVDTWKDVILNMSVLLFAVGISVVVINLSHVALLLMRNTEKSRAEHMFRLDKWRLVGSLRFHCTNFWNYYNTYPSEAEGSD